MATVISHRKSGRARESEVCLFSMYTIHVPQVPPRMVVVLFLVAGSVMPSGHAKLPFCPLEEDYISFLHVGGNLPDLLYAFLSRDSGELYRRSILLLAQQVGTINMASAEPPAFCRDVAGSPLQLPVRQEAKHNARPS